MHFGKSLGSGWRSAHVAAGLGRLSGDERRSPRSRRRSAAHEVVGCRANLVVYFGDDHSLSRRGQYPAEHDPPPFLAESPGLTENGSER
jgi:hypothetical protein